MSGVFITGASSGIGEALARHYAPIAPALGLAARRKVELDAIAAGLSVKCATYSLDVTDERAVEQAAKDYVQRFGAPDLVIANAGISIGTRGDDPADVSKLRRVLDVNVTGLAATLAAFAPAMRAARSGTLCGIASVAGFRGLPGAGAYSSSKAAAISWLEALRIELRGSGVSVVTICPGFIDTPMTQVNRYRMPFLMEVDRAAEILVDGLERGKGEIHFPKPLSWTIKTLRILPYPLYQWIIRKATGDRQKQAG